MCAERRDARPSSQARTPADTERGSGPSLIHRLRNLSRFQFLELGFGLTLGVVALRTAWWQTIAAGDLAAAAKTERTQDVTIPHRRGAIYDRNGVVLAQSVDVTRITCDPTVVLADAVSTMAQAIQKLFGGAVADYTEKLTRTGTRNVVIIDAADPDTAAKLQEQGLTGLYYTDYYQRVYPLKEVGCNILGAINNDGDPTSGLELQYNELLTGTDGHRRRERGITGGVIVDGQDDYTPAVDGLSVRISIDTDIQRVMQEALESTVDSWGCDYGAAVALDPATGEILGCASTPTFDPNRLDLLASIDALGLRPISSSYEPGSVLKPLTMSMAVDLGIANETSTFWVPATVQVGDDTVGDADQRSYETSMTLANMLQRSSNVGTVLVVREVGAKNYADYIAAFGLGQSTGVDYPYEEVPHVRTLDEFDGAWEAMAYGQSIACTPLQVARAIGTIANEGVISNPHFLMTVGDTEVTYSAGERVISTAAAESVSWMMNSVVTDGYAYTGAVNGYNVAAKTGTAERYDATTGTYSTDHYTVSFVGFAPTENPAAVLYVLFDNVDEEHEELTAGGPWAQIMEEILARLNVAPSV